MTQTQTSKADLQKRFDRNFPTIERAYNNRRKKDDTLPSLMMKDGFPNPIALQVIEAMYADSAKDEAIEAIQSDDKTERVEELRQMLNESQARSLKLNRQLTEAQAELESRLFEIQKLQTDNTKEYQILSETTQTDKQIISELHTEKTELQSELSEKENVISELQTELESREQKSKRFINRFKSETVTVVGLFFSILYQGFHSQRFFYERYLTVEKGVMIIPEGGDWKNTIISTFAAIAFSIAGFKLTLHTQNKIWIYGIALIDLFIYCSTKDLSLSNALGGFAVAVSIVAYSHILQASNPTK